MSTLGTLFVMLSTPLTMLQASKTAGVLLVVGLWMLYHG